MSKFFSSMLVVVFFGSSVAMADGTWCFNPETDGVSSGEYSSLFSITRYKGMKKVKSEDLLFWRAGMFDEDSYFQTFNAIPSGRVLRLEISGGYIDRNFEYMPKSACRE